MRDSPEQSLPEDETVERVDSVKRDHERKHFVFAMILVMGCVLGLPVLGSFYVLFVRWGWLSSPLAQ